MEVDASESRKQSFEVIGWWFLIRPKWEAWNGVKVREGQDGLHVCVDRDEWVVQKSISDFLIRDHSEICRVDGFLTKDYALMAFYGAMPSHDQIIYCFERASKQLIWTRKIWNAQQVNGISGTPRFDNRNIMVEGDNTVLVFDAYHYSLSIQGFRLKDGMNIFRFHTSLRSEFCEGDIPAKVFFDIIGEDIPKRILLTS